MSKYDQVSKEELVAALLEAINKKYASHSAKCDLRTAMNTEPRCTCNYTQWYLSTQQMLDRANR